MTTLYASIIQLYALQGGDLLQDAGRWANAAFYGILGQVDPTLAEALHQWNGLKPFTVSAPRGDVARPCLGKPAHLRVGQECWLRITTLGHQIFQLFIQRFLLGGGRPTLKIGPFPFAVAEVLTTPAAHPWAGYCEAADLLENAIPAERVTLEFASPTAFNVNQQQGGKGKFVLSPEPALVFGNLAHAWNAFLQPQLDARRLEDSAKQALVTHSSIKTCTLLWDKRVQKGFTGRCTYDLRRLPEDDRRGLSALASFAFYAGVGGKTAQGMGQCRALALAVAELAEAALRPAQGAVVVEPAEAALRPAQGAAADP